MAGEKMASITSAAEGGDVASDACRLRQMWKSRGKPRAARMEGVGSRECRPPGTDRQSAAEM